MMIDVEEGGVLRYIDFLRFYGSKIFEVPLLSFPKRHVLLL